MSVEGQGLLQFAQLNIILNHRHSPNRCGTCLLR